MIVTMYNSISGKLDGFLGLFIDPCDKYSTVKPGMTAIPRYAKLPHPHRDLELYGGNKSSQKLCNPFFLAIFLWLLLVVSITFFGK